MNDISEATFLTVKEAKDVLRFGENKTYNIIQEAYKTGKPFPVTKIGRDYRIYRKPFMEWAKGLGIAITD